jgi:hypothetical protein
MTDSDLASGPQAAATGFHAVYTIPDTATAVLGILVAVGVLATAGHTRRPALRHLPLCDARRTTSVPYR